MSLVGSREPPCRRPSDGAVGAELPCEAIGRLRRPNSPCNDHLADLGDLASKSHDYKERLCHQEPVLDVWCCLTPQNIPETFYVS